MAGNKLTLLYIMMIM